MKKKVIITLSEGGVIDATFEPPTGGNKLQEYVLVGHLLTTLMGIIGTKISGQEAADATQTFIEELLLVASNMQKCVAVN
jgi:hypothetical protein